MADSPQNPPKKAAELPADHPLKVKEAALVQKQADLNKLDDRAQARAGHDLSDAKRRLESQLDEVRAAIAKEGK